MAQLAEDDPNRMVTDEEKSSKRLTLPVTADEAAIIIDKTTPKFPGDVLWTTHAAHLLMATVIVGAALVYLRFVLVPLLMSYFAIFLIGPVMDLLEYRPYQMGTRIFCRENWKNVERKRFQGTLRGDLIDICLLGKVPHMAAVVVCLIIVFTSLYGIYFLVTSNINTFLEAEEEKEKNGDDPMGVKLNTFLNERVDDLEETIGDIIRPWICETNGTNVGVRMIDTDVDGLQVMKISLFDFLTDEWTTEYNDAGWRVDGQTDFSCERKKLFGTSEGYTLDELMGILSAFMTPVNDFILVLLLTVYILLERPAGRTLSGNGIIFEHIEYMVKNYVALKTILSAGTGLAVAAFLIIFNVPLAMVFGLLAFLFNYIPCVGSVIATFLPIPVLILDENMSANQKIMAFLMPASVQMYVGNVLEPVLFGSSLNLTSLSILVALTFCSYLWGICGAVLSVPLLGAVKICLHHTDHPLAKHVVALLREQASIDYDFDITYENAREERASIENTDDVVVPPRNGEVEASDAKYDPDFDEEDEDEG